MIEKHFTLRRADGGVDSAFSLEPPELTALVVETERAWQSLGAISYGPTKAEEKSLLYRRSLYVAEDMKAGDVLTATFAGGAAGRRAASSPLRSAAGSPHQS